jgi:prepilin-type N-terminal cleavage/methylation domain-containing protein
MQNKKSRSAGFTLVELLVVIAIIGILGAVSVIGSVTYRNRALNSRVQQEVSSLQKAASLFYTANQRYPDPATASNVDDACYGSDGGVWQKCCVSLGGCSYQGEDIDTLSGDGDFAAAERAPEWMAFLGTRAEAVLNGSLPTFLTEAPTSPSGFKGVFYDCADVGCTDATVYFTVATSECTIGEPHDDLEGVCEDPIL